MGSNRHGPWVLLPLLSVLACAYQGPTTTRKEPPPPPAGKNVSHRELRDVEMTAEVPVTRKPGPVRLSVGVHMANHSDRRIKLQEQNFQLVSADGTMHEVSRTLTADAGQAGWVEHQLRPGERFDAVVSFDDVDPLAEQLTLDAFYTDVETGDRGPELAVPVKTRPQAAAAERTDAGSPTE